ncbi:DUF481 domain-containing protein [Gammaproteobacteria bacterium]|nr:DUF481 domain-containing protein [Gammaproteobacteria bacterium]
MLRKILIFVLLFGWSIRSFADVVFLENGDRISGIIKEIWGDVLIIEPEYSDPIELDRDIVVGIDSDRKLAIELDGSKETPYLMSRSLKEGRVVLDAEDTKFDVALDSIKRAEEIKDFDWDIKFDLGSTFSRGNTDSQTTNLQWDGNLIIKDHRIKSDLFISREEVAGEKTKAKDRVNLGYNYFFIDQWFLAVNLAAERDPISLLNSRYSLSPAIGYDFLDDPNRFLHVQLGAGYSSERSNNLTSTSTTIDWKLNFYWELLNGDLQFFHDQNLLKNLEGRKNLVFYSQTGFRYEINEDIYLNFQANYDYDSQPAGNAKEEDLTFIIGAGVNL